MAARRRTPQQRRVDALAARTAELSLALSSTQQLAEERGERISALLDYFDVRFAEWGKEREALERTIRKMHANVRDYERRLAMKETVDA